MVHAREVERQCRRVGWDLGEDPAEVEVIGDTARVESSQNIFKEG